MRIAICDDETIILDEVSSYIKKYSKLCGKSELEVFPFNSASSLLNSIDDGALFDILVLDVYIGDEPWEIRDYDKEKCNELIRKLVFEKKISKSALERATGISRGTIIRICKDV